MAERIAKLVETERALIDNLYTYISYLLERVKKGKELDVKERAEIERAKKIITEERGYKFKLSFLEYFKKEARPKKFESK